MKTLAVLTFLVLVTLSQTEEQKKPQQTVLDFWYHQIEDLQVDCLTESGAYMLDVHEFFQHKEDPNNKPLKCFWKCIALKLNLINDKEEPSIDAFVKQGGLQQDVAERCSKLEGSDFCERAYNMVKCIYDVY